MAVEAVLSFARMSGDEVGGETKEVSAGRVGEKVLGIDETAAVEAAAVVLVSASAVERGYGADVVEICVRAETTWNYGLIFGWVKIQY